MKKHSQRLPIFVLCAFCLVIGWAAIAPLGCSVCNGAEDCSTSAAGTGATGGAAGTGATGGIAGAGGGGGTGGTEKDSGTTGDASGPTCGGFAGLRCPNPDTTFCRYPEQMACGQGDITGVCLPRPATCSKDCPGVCGCDGKRHCNACEANRAGTDVGPAGTCPQAH